MDKSLSESTSLAKTLSDVPLFSSSNFCQSVMNVLYGLEGRAIEMNDSSPMNFDETPFHADKCARKFILFSCLKWFLDCEYEQDVINFCIYADHYENMPPGQDAADFANFLYKQFIAENSPHELYQAIPYRSKVHAELAKLSPLLFSEVQEECMKVVKYDFYAIMFKHPLFNAFATSVHMSLPALVTNMRLTIPMTIRQSGYVLNLMEALENFEIKDQTDRILSNISDGTSHMLNNSIRRLLTFAVLKQFVEREVSMENITFYISVSDFKAKLARQPDLSEAEKRQMAFDIFAEFIDTGSPSEVNIQHNLRSAMQAKLQNPITSSIFDKAQKEVLQLLHNNSYERFTKSAEYQDFTEKFKSIPQFHSLDSDKKKKDEKLREKYKLPPTEQLIVKYTCAMDNKGMLFHGSLALSNLYICFNATVFGFKTKEVIPLQKITSIDLHLDNPSVFESDGHIKVVYKDRVFIFRSFPYVQRVYLTVRKLYHHALKTLESVPIDERLNSARGEAEKDPYTLTERDWLLFQEGAKVVAFSKDMPILKQGDKSRNLYQIARGRVRVEKGGDVLRTMDEGQFFGEISFLEGVPASATVLADENPTTVYIIDGHFIEKLFKIQPTLTGRFYNFLAMQLSDRLRNRKVSLATIPAEHFHFMAADRFQKMLGFGKEEDLILTIPCSLERFIRQTGNLYVSTNYLSFSAQIIGLKTKEILPIKSIATITANESTIEVTTEDDREFIFTNIENVKEAYEGILSTWRVVKANRNLMHRGIRPIDHGRGTAKADEKTNDNLELNMKVFHAGAKLTTFSRDDMILEDGSRTRCLYQINKGQVRVQKGLGPEAVIFRKLGPGQIFGEMSFLEPIPASASIVADEDHVEVYVMERAYVDSLLRMDPELPGRFYRFLATNLAYRLRK